MAGCVTREAPSDDPHRPCRREDDSSGRDGGVVATAEHGESVESVASRGDRDQVVDLYALGRAAAG
jgi:hypothetical protein